jgi:hypothetical protein
MTMMTYTPADAPGFAKASSSFARDETCKDVHYVTGSDYDQVYIMVKTLFDTNDNLVDYDVNYSLEGDLFVGVTCEDV